MSIVQEQLEELLKENNIPFQTVKELGGDNFSVIPKGSTTPDRLEEIIHNKGIFNEDDVTYDDEEGDVIIHFEGNEDDSDKAIRKIKTQVVRRVKAKFKSELSQKIRRNLRYKGLIQ